MGRKAGACMSFPSTMMTRHYTTARSPVERSKRTTIPSATMHYTAPRSTMEIQQRVGATRHGACQDEEECRAVRRLGKVERESGSRPDEEAQFIAMGNEATRCFSKTSDPIPSHLYIVQFGCAYCLSFSRIPRRSSVVLSLPFFLTFVFCSFAATRVLGTPHVTPSFAFAFTAWEVHVLFFSSHRSLASWLRQKYG